MKKALIITDGSKPVRTISLYIKQALADDYKVKVMPAKKFAGNDLLPVDYFFIGCKKQNPKSFEYLSNFLAHVNLASRKCGLFGLNEKAVNYLTSIITDSEAVYTEILLAAEDTTQDTVNKWLDRIMK